MPIIGDLLIDISMTAEQERLLKNFETRIRQTMLRCEELQKENDRLSEALAQKEEAYAMMVEAFDEVTEKYDNLKLAKSMAGRDKELHEARLELSKLVREINACNDERRYFQDTLIRCRRRFLR